MLVPALPSLEQGTETCQRVCVQLARVTWRVVEELAPDPFALRSVITPSYPSLHSHITSHKYTTSPTCQILPEIQALGCADSESVCGRGPPPLPDWGTPTGSEHLTPDSGCSSHQNNSPLWACCSRPPVSLWGGVKTHAHESVVLAHSQTPFLLQALKQGVSA